MKQSIFTQKQHFKKIDINFSFIHKTWGKYMKWTRIEIHKISEKRKSISNMFFFQTEIFKKTLAI